LLEKSRFLKTFSGIKLRTFWLALAVREHPFHASAAHWWTPAAAESVMVCRVTALGLGEVRWQEEPPGADPLWRSLWRSHQLGHRHLTDADPAALALISRLRLVSFDRAFELFTDLDLLLLSDWEGVF
jgi:hypothetical protein